MSNPNSRGQQRDKPFRDALRIAISEAEDNPRKLRRIAEKLFDKAAEGDVAAIKEIADRLDGKVPQGIGGDDELGPVQLQTIERLIVDPKQTPDSNG
jgi:hypothetical protein